MEMYLRNEKDKNNMFETFDYPFAKFNDYINKINKDNEKFYASRKEEIKQFGGKWDPINKKWFIYENNPNKGIHGFDLVK